MSAFARQPGASTKGRHGLQARPVEYRVPELGGAWDDAPGIHPTAVIHPSAQIDDSARIGPYCIVGPNVRIGARTALNAHVVAHSNTTIGADNHVFPFAVLGHDPQDLKYRGEDTTLEVGDRNIIREHATLHRGTGVGGGVTRVGSDNLIMVGAHVAHDCIVEDHVILANGVMLGGHVVVESGATLAGAAAVHHFATVGRLSFVGGLARITKDVPPFLVVEGHPAEPRKVNSVALTRRGWESKDVEALRAAFKALFRPRSSRRAAMNGAHGINAAVAHAAAGEFENGETSETSTRDASAASSMQSVIARLRGDAAACAAVLDLCDFLERMQSGVHGRWRETLRDRAGTHHKRG